MDELDDARRRTNRTIYQLDFLYQRLSPQEFGRVMQQVLACEFATAGFHVVENPVGVPDFTATRTMVDGNQKIIAVEVKTSDKPKIALTQRDLDGIRSAGQTGVLAVLSFPAMNPGWLLIPAESISPRSWEIRHLRMKQQVDVGFDVDDIFHRITAALEPQLAPRGTELVGWIKAHLHAFRAMSSLQHEQHNWGSPAAQGPR
jgi:hypothetical protein